MLMVSKSIDQPRIIARLVTNTPNKRATFRECSALSTPKVVILVAGPAIRKAKAAPGLIPFKIATAAMGVAPDAHTYKGIPSIANKGTCR